MVAVGTAHVGSVAVAVTTGAPGAAFTVTSVEASQPAAFFTHTLWAPGYTEVKPPLDMMHKCRYRIYTQGPQRVN